MAIEIKEATRVFKMKKGTNETVLEDVAPHLPPGDILDIYLRDYPELVNATIGHPTWVNDQVHYTFDTAAGTKG
jgi:PRTRC genetic system protein C